MHERMAWSVPGYVATELVGFGASGEVWRARSARDGGLVALKRLHCAPSAADLAALRQRVVSLAEAGQPHLLPVRAVLAGAQATVLVLDYAAGGSLAMLLRRRGRLRPGELVTVLVPLASALDFLHGNGIAHGSVHPANVLFTVDGRPLLAEPELPGVASGRSDPDGVPRPAGPATDVLMLARVAGQALTGAPTCPGPDDLAGLDAPAPLVRALRRALSADPGDRGTAAEFALAVRASCEPEPVPLAGPPVARPVALVVPAGPRHRWQEPPGSRRRPGRWLVGAAVLAVACGGAAWVTGGAAGPSAGAAPAGPGAATPPTSARPAPARDWLAVLDGLDAVRSRAYERGDPALLRQVYLPGSHLSLDTAQLGRITATGETVRGVRHRLRLVAVESSGPGEVRLRVAQSLPASLRLRSGRPVAPIPGRPESVIVVELTLSPDGWRLA